MLWISYLILAILIALVVNIYHRKIGVITTTMGIFISIILFTYSIFDFRYGKTNHVLAEVKAITGEEHVEVMDIGSSYATIQINEYVYGVKLNKKSDVTKIYTDYNVFYNESGIPWESNK